MMQTTLDNRIAESFGVFWEPFAYGDAEQEYMNHWWKETDTWIMGRRLYEAVAPWWEVVARGGLPNDLPEMTASTREFGRIFDGLEKFVVSNTLESTTERTVMSGDVASQLEELKAGPGKRIVLSCGPALFGHLVSVTGLIDELHLVVHPAVIASGPRLFEEMETGLALELIEAITFEAGSVLLRLRVLNQKYASSGLAEA